MAKRAHEATLAIGVSLSVVLAVAVPEAWPDGCVHESPLTFEWAPASGTVDSYEVYVSRNGAGFPAIPTAVVSGGTPRPEYSFAAEDQSSYQLRVRAVSAAAGAGPYSSPSDRIWFFANGTADDSDGDGLPDAAEAATGCTSPFAVDSDGDGILDGEEDGNRNGQIDAGESDPCQADLVQEAVCDNGDACASYTGHWHLARAAGAYGGDALTRTSGATYTWSFQIPRSGAYHLYLWWAETSTRCTDCPVTVTCGGRLLDSFTVNQTQDGGKWNWFGQHEALIGEECRVTITAQSATTSTCADAVKLTGVGGEAQCGDGLAEAGEECDGNDAPECPGLCQNDCTCAWITRQVCDNGDSCSQSTGRWNLAQVGPAYGADSLVAKDWGTYTWTFQIPVTGNYRWSMWWTSHKSRNAAVPATIKCGSRVLQRLTLNQQEGGGQWKDLGLSPAVVGEACTLKLWVKTAETVSADAVKLELQ